MNESDALNIVQTALWTVVIASGPPVIAAMVIGIVIAFLQALTQVQEMTLTFIPKMIAVFGVVAMAGPFIGGQVLVFTQQVYARVETGFAGPGVRAAVGVARNPVGGSDFDLRPGFLGPPGE